MTRALVRMLRADTGEARCFVTDFEEGDDFLWGEGNYAGESNRHRFFERECLGVADDEDRASRPHPIIHVSITALADGRVLYEDSDE